METTHHKEDGHNHAHGGIFGTNTELIFSLICGGLLGIGYFMPAPTSLMLFIAAYFLVVSLRPKRP
ncbi:hypothetical protein MKQ70_13245 [Chitinophaga sedimenti]|uniref:hypothetical protein n=1 Tax=Chitinophaga sedimenti TaxID=2033606 RepID=UPI0020055B93|nr:hypothetical protein [Chitinophaga sedimenti]MCK7555932.1 hypothetical protein [Chitinophaga sedimenti]